MSTINLLEFASEQKKQIILSPLVEFIQLII